MFNKSTYLMKNLLITCIGLLLCSALVSNTSYDPVSFESGFYVAVDDDGSHPSVGFGFPAMGILINKLEAAVLIAPSKVLNQKWPIQYKLDNNINTNYDGFKQMKTYECSQRYLFC